MKKAELVNGFKNGHAQYRAQHGGKHIMLSKQMQDRACGPQLSNKLVTASLPTSTSRTGEFEL
jgi:hypothetical protein